MIKQQVIWKLPKRSPGAVKLLRKGSPIIEENIQDTIAEIQKKARQICEITRGSGTVYEAPGNELQKLQRVFAQTIYIICKDAVQE